MTIPKQLAIPGALPLPPRQRDALDAILAYHAATLRTPTMRELGDILGISFKAAHQLVMHLRLKGALRWTRRIELADGTEEPRRLVRYVGGVRRVVGFGVT